MDLTRRGPKKSRWFVRGGMLVVVSLCVVVANLGVSRFFPNLPIVDRRTMVIDQVRRGEFVHEIRCVGQLVSEEVTLRAAKTKAGVDRIVALPGVEVHPDTLLLVLANEELEMGRLDAQNKVGVAEADRRTEAAKLNHDLLQLESDWRKLSSDHEQAEAQYNVSKALRERNSNAVSLQRLKLEERTAATLLEQRDFARQSHEQFKLSMADRLAKFDVQISIAKTNLQREQARVDALRVVAGVHGVLAQVPVEVGQQFEAGELLAKIVNPHKLKAELRVAEVEARYVRVGQSAKVDTHHGLIQGTVTRIDPEVHLSVQSGEFVAIMGPSGCGKSTLLAIMGLMDAPTEGRVLLDGRDTTRLTLTQRARLRNQLIGFVFQSFHLVGDLTSLDNVALPLTYAGFDVEERRSIASEALARVDMQHRARHFPSQLSGGQQQRVAIARAIAGSPSLILADEPTGNLDSENGLAVMELLAEIHQEQGTTICLVTHETRHSRFASRAIQLLDGKIVSDMVTAS